MHFITAAWTMRFWLKFGSGSNTTGGMHWIDVEARAVRADIPSRGAKRMCGYSCSNVNCDASPIKTSGKADLDA